MQPVPLPDSYKLELYRNVNCCLSVTAAVCHSDCRLFLTLGEKVEGGKMEHLLKFLQKCVLVGTAMRALEDHSGADSYSQGSAPHSSSVGHGSEMCWGLAVALWVRDLLQPCWARSWGSAGEVTLPTTVGNSVGMRSKVKFGYWCSLHFVMVQLLNC